jgi:hypothetical protein
VTRAVSAPRRSIPDPRQAPIDQSAHGLLPVRPERLVPQALRDRFRHPPDWTPEFIDDRWRLGGDPLRPAAVLVPLVMREELPRMCTLEFRGRLRQIFGGCDGECSIPGNI